MSAAFDRRSKTRLPYRRSWKPSVQEVEDRIIAAWFDLDRAARISDDKGCRIQSTRLHDLGVIRFKAMQRERTA